MDNREISRQIAREERVDVWKVDKALELLNDGNTLPFVARYRKDAHGGLDEQQLRRIQVHCNDQLLARFVVDWLLYDNP